MGAFLPKPCTDTFPDDDTNGKYAFGSSSMQGFRTSQEDAHMCLLNFDTETCLFGVFDGHGGSEVAQYASKKFPEFLKNNESYKKNEFEKALKEAFIEFDASLIKSEVYEELKRLAGDNFSSEEEEEDMLSNLKALKEEAGLPISELLERYQTGEAKKERKSKLKAQKSIGESISSSSKESDENDDIKPCSSTEIPITLENGESSNKKSEITSSVDNQDNEASCSSSSLNVDNSEQQCSSKTNEKIEQDEPTSSSVSNEHTEGKNKNEILTNSLNEKESSSKSKKRIKPTQVSSQPTTFLQMLDEIDEEDSEDDSMLGDENSDVDSEMFDDSEEDENDESESDEDLSDEDEETNNIQGFLNQNSIKQNPFKKFSSEGPGKDSGCTAVIALLKDNKLYVANAGDSRCVLSRNGKEIEMSYDHKPTSEIEFARIKKAGGYVTSEGRVNGGLNLSRAFGDHSYKTNETLSLEEQMITALPDIKVIDLTPEDDFIVVACDGIWNSMSSKEVVDFINEEINKAPNQKLSDICNKLFFKCLAEDTRGDGSGCDNFTCIIIKLKDLPKKEELIAGSNGEIKKELKENVKEDKTLNEDKEVKIEIVNEINSNDNGKRKREDENCTLNGTESIHELPSSKKNKI